MSVIHGTQFPISFPTLTAHCALCTHRSSVQGKNKGSERGKHPHRVDDSILITVTTQEGTGCSTKNQAADTAGSADPRATEAAMLENTPAAITPPPTTITIVAGTAATFNAQVGSTMETPAPSTTATSQVEIVTERETRTPSIAAASDGKGSNPEETPAVAGDPTVGMSEEEENEEREDVQCGSPWTSSCFDRSQCVGPDGELVRICFIKYGLFGFTAGVAVKCHLNKDNGINVGMNFDPRDFIGLVYTSALWGLGSPDMQGVPHFTFSKA